MLSLVVLFAAVIICLLLGMGFSMMESTSLAINRIRLLRLFSEADHEEGEREKEIFGNTKDVYFVSRLGLSLCLTVAAYANYHLLLLLWRGLPDSMSASPAIAHAAAFLLTLLLVTLAFLFFVYGVPRFLMPSPSYESEDEIPFVMRFFMACALPLAKIGRIKHFVPIHIILPHHSLTKSDLLTLVTDLEPEEKGDEESETDLDEESEEEEPDEDEIIYNILDLEETLVREIMRPINTVVAIRFSDLSSERIRQLARSTGYSRFPVYRERIINLCGYVAVEDVLWNPDADQCPREAFIHPAFFVPEFMRVSSLLQEFLASGRQAAVVVDEYGGCSGWITREDIFEEIVGELDPHRMVVRQDEDGSYLVDGSMRIDDLIEEIPLTFSEPIYDTIAGFFLHVHGRIPSAGDSVVTDEAVFTIERVEENRICEIRIQLEEPGEPEDESDNEPDDSTPE